MRKTRSVTLALAAIFAWGLAISPSQALAAKAKPDKIDINSASQSELESLPGVGAATAQKIIAGRPFSSVKDLARVGVSADTIAKVRPLVKAGRGSTAMAEPANAEKAAGATKATKEDKAARPAKEEKKAESPAPSGAKVDLNRASEKELEALPAVGAATAKKIIEGRPYASVADLAKAGIPARTIETISPLVTVSAKKSAPAETSAPASSAPPIAPASKPVAKPAKPSSSSEAASAAAGPPPSKGMVWVNTETKVFHREGDKWYGNTKHGKYMTEADAVKAGYRESKEHLTKQ